MKQNETSPRQTLTRVHDSRQRVSTTAVNACSRQPLTRVGGCLRQRTASVIEYGYHLHDRRDTRVYAIQNHKK